MVAERPGHMHEQVDVAGAKHEAPAKLERIPPQAVLTVAGVPGSRSGDSILWSKEMQEARTRQTRSSVRAPFLVHQQRKGDPGFFSEEPSVAAVAESNGRKPCACRFECPLLLAQLRDLLAAEDSSVVP